MIHSALLSLPNPEIWLGKLVDRLFGGTPRGHSLYSLWERSKKECYYCNEIITLNQASRDHRHPKSRGGDNSLDNIRLACKQCNSAKQNMTEYEYWQLLREDQAIYGTSLKRPISFRGKANAYISRRFNHRRNRYRRS